MAWWIDMTAIWTGVGSWNQWREISPKRQPDLSGVSLKGANLTKANLKEVNLKSADLFEANLTEANLKRAFLVGADMGKVNLTKANLAGAFLSGVDLGRANLTGADLTGAHLARADLTRADLTGADLTGADLTGAILKGANLTGACLRGAYVSKVDLTAAVLTKADLTEAFLIKTQAPNTDFNQAVLTAACIEDWNINSATQLDGVICDFIYLRLPDERCPIVENFAPGEFSKLFQKVCETIELTFLQGIDWKAFFASFQKVQRVKSEGAELSIQAIEKKSDGAFIIRLSVPANVNKLEIETFWKKEYDLQLKALDGQGHYPLEDERVEIYRLQGADLLEIVKQMAAKYSNNKTLAVF